MRRSQPAWRRALRPTLVSAALAAACASPQPPRLAYARLHSAKVGATMRYAVYAPRDLAPDERLPLVVFLHGGGDGPTCFDDAGLGRHLDQAMRAGRVPRVVILLPDGELGFWENWRDGTRLYRDWVLQELLPRVQRQYHTQACPAGCHVMGNSMGGYGALRFALLEPGRFASVTAISAPVFDTERMLEIRDSFWMGLVLPVERIWGKDQRRADIERHDLFHRWTRQSDLHGARLMLTWGDQDRAGVATSSRRFHQHLRRHGIEHRAFEYPGGHDWRSWTPVIERALREQVGAGRASPGASANTTPRGGAGRS